MKYLPLVLAMFVFVAAAASWFLFREDGEDVELERSHRSAIESDEVGAATELPRREPGRIDPDLVGASVVDADRPEAPVAKVYREQPEDGLLISVVDAESKEPVSGIDVFLVSESMVPEAAMIVRRSPFEMMAAYGHRYRAGQDGKLRVARLDERCAVLVLGEGRWGQRDFRPGADEVTVEVRDLPNVEVLVIDEDGRPVIGAAVCWRVAHAFGGGNRFVHDRYVEITSAPEGRVRLHFPDEGRRRENEEHFVALQGAFAEPVQMPIDLDDLPAETVTLVAPKTGSLEIEVLPAEGRELPEKPFAISVAPVDPGAASGPERLGDGRAHQGVVIDGRLRLDSIGLGLELELRLQALGSSEFQPLLQTIKGPVVAGEVVEARFELPAAPTRCVATGRFIDEQGRPFVDTRFRGSSARRTPSGSSSSSQTARTDEEGRFRMAFDLVEADEGVTWLVEFSVDETGEPQRRIEIDFGGRGIGEQDLGDVVLRPDPLLARGRVTGPDGEPHPGAWISAIPVVEDPNTWNSHRYQSSSARSDKDGGFELRGEIDSNEVQLSASAEGFVADPIDVARGATGIELKLRALAKFQVRVVAQAGGGLDGLQASLVREEQEYHGGGNQLLEDGRYEIHVEPGRYDFRIASPGNAGQILLERKGLVLEAGRTLDLGEVAIRHSGKTIQLMIDPGQGAEDFLWGTFRVFAPGGSEVLLEEHEAIHGQPIKLFVKSLPVEVEIAVPGYRVRRYPVAREKSKVRLEPGLQVKLQVMGVSDFGDDVIARVDLMEAESRQWRSDNASADFKPKDGEVTFLVSKPGRYQVNFMIGTEYAGGSTMSGVTMKNPPIIEVKETTGLQTFTISPDREALDRALAGSRRDD